MPHSLTPHVLPIRNGPPKRTASEVRSNPECSLKRSARLPRTRRRPHKEGSNRNRLNREDANLGSTEDEISPLALSPFDPADSTTWISQPSQPVSNRITAALETPEYTRDEQTAWAKSDDLGSILNTPSPPPELLAEQANFLTLVDEKLRLCSNNSPSTEAQISRVQSVSSSYPTEGMRSAQVDSPMPLLPAIHKLSFSDLSKYGNYADCVPSFGSTSSSKTRVVSAAGSTQEAIKEAEVAATQWEGERQPIKSYHRFEFEPSEDEAPACLQEKLDSDQETNAEPQTVRRSSVAERTSAIKLQFDGYDGAVDTRTTGGLAQSMRRGNWPRAAKRKTSHFSLRSLTMPFVKRTRIDMKQLASNAYHGGTRRFGRACELMKRQREEEKKQYAAWKALRRRNKPGDAIKGKIKKGFGTFSVERSRYGHEMWWKEGVDKYCAPEWMKF